MLTVRPARRIARAFTLLELIVVIVILGILAALAIPTFQAVIDRAEDQAVVTTAEAVGRDAVALAAFEPAAADRSHLVEVLADEVDGVALLAPRSAATWALGSELAEAWTYSEVTLDVDLNGDGDRTDTGVTLDFNGDGSFWADVAIVNPYEALLWVDGEFVLLQMSADVNGAVAAEVLDPDDPAHFRDEDNNG